MRLERGNLVRITDDEVKIAKLKEEGYKEVEEVSEEKADKEVEEVSEEKKTTGRGRANNKK